MTPDERTTSPVSEWEEHLEELRRRILCVLVVWFVSTLVAFALSERVAAFLTGPVAHLGVRLYAFGPADKFLAHLHIAAVAGLVFTAPFLVLQTGVFVWPGLLGSEKRAAAVALTAAPVLLLAGSAAAYVFFAPVVLKFFLSFAASDGVEHLWGLRQYLSFLAGLMLGAGLLLQLPLVLLVLFALGIVTPRTVARYRAHAVLLIFFAAAVCTPPDVTSQVMLGVPLYLLFEATLLIGGAMQRTAKSGETDAHPFES